MPDTHITKNYMAHGGDELVIGGKLTILEGATVEGLTGGGGGSSYTLPTASADTLGGVKVGTGLTITDGVLSATGITPAAAQADSTASTIASIHRFLRPFTNNIANENGMKTKAVPPSPWNKIIATGGIATMAHTNMGGMRLKDSSGWERRYAQKSKAAAFIGSDTWTFAPGRRSMLLALLSYAPFTNTIASSSRPSKYSNQE